MSDQLFNDNKQETPQATPEQPITPVPNSSDLFADQIYIYIYIYHFFAQNATKKMK